MEQTCAFEPIGISPEPSPAASTVEYGANVMVLYEDPPTLAWAQEVCDRVKNLVGPDALRLTWWKTKDLDSPGVLAGAVSTALRADVIVVAIHAAEGMPLPVSVWVNSWLPHRPQAVGSLMALIAMPERPRLQLKRVREYLCAVARQGRLDFLVEERKLPAASPRPAPVHALLAAASAGTVPRRTAAATPSRPSSLSWTIRGRRVPKSTVRFSLTGCSSEG